MFVEQLDIQNLTRSIAVAKTRPQPGLLRPLAIAILAFKDDSNLAVDHILGRSDGLNLTVEQEYGAVRKLLHQPQVVRHK